MSEALPVVAEPLPCPFCGSSAGVEGFDGRWLADCDSCGATVGIFGSTRQAAVAEWNRRADSAATARIAELEAKLAEVRDALDHTNRSMVRERDRADELDEKLHAAEAQAEELRLERDIEQAMRKKWRSTAEAADAQVAQLTDEQRKLYSALGGEQFALEAVAADFIRRYSEEESTAAGREAK